MEIRVGAGTKAAFEAANTVLDLVCADTRQRLDARARLALVRQSQQLKRRMEAITAGLIAEAERTGSSEQVASVSMTDWLGCG
jgi:hypothetical protein